MLLKVEIPAADAAFRAGYVAKWHVAEGDSVEFGDDLCDIAIDEFVAMQRTKRATLLGSSNPFRKRRVKDAVSLREGRGVTHMRLTSSEGGLTLGKILVPEGGRIAIGDLVGLLSGGDSGEIAADEAALAGAGEARIVANMPDEDDIDV
jgi:pyruvate/2-oxoglutarate dehydrogenase complex dihydrolipoamide acyltransferase (E2) component